MEKQIYIPCPRCLGKGHVDSDDIKRLKRENFWDPGLCAYCEGSGQVTSDMINKINPDALSLVTDLDSMERENYLNDTDPNKDIKVLFSKMMTENETLSQMTPEELDAYYEDLKIFITQDLQNEQTRSLVELESLIGLNKVKKDINSLINYIKVSKEREKHGLPTSPISLHCVFTGSPGTGKTTVARIIASIYKDLGILKKGHLIETDRSGLIAEYLGQTAVKVNNIVDSALDGILFIDEAYSIVGKNNDDYGKEAVATLIKRIEDDRDRLVVIMAGYKEEMDLFINSNPGFQSRFNRYIHFDDYTPEELISIFKSLCKKQDYILTESAEKRLLEIINISYTHRDKSFGNGRYVRNLFEKTLEKQSDRIVTLTNNSKETLSTIEKVDLEF